MSSPIGHDGSFSIFLSFPPNCNVVDAVKRQRQITTLINFTKGTCLLDHPTSHPPFHSFAGTFFSLQTAFFLTVRHDDVLWGDSLSDVVLNWNKTETDCASGVDGDDDAGLEDFFMLDQIPQLWERGFWEQFVEFML